MLPSTMLSTASTVNRNFHWASKLSKQPTSSRRARAKPAALEPTERKATTGVGDPSYTSGVHWWNGTAAILKATVANTNTSERAVIGEAAVFRATAIASRLVLPPLNP